MLVLLHPLADATDLEVLETTFGLNEEQSVPTWYSSIQLLALAGLLALLGAAYRRRDSRITRTAWIGAIIAAFFSVDEVATIHESITGVLGRFDAVPTFEGGHGIWIFVYALIGIVVLVVTAPGILQIARLRARQAVWFALGALVFVAGGVGVEILSYSGSGQIVLEEAMELLGVAIMVAASYHLIAGIAVTAPHWIRDVAAEGAAAPSTTPTDPDAPTT